MSEPSQEFVRLIASRVTDDRLTAGTKTAVGRHIPNAFSAIFRERLNDRLSSAIDEGGDEEPPSSSEIETSEIEIEGFQIVRAIASELVDPSRVIMRDAKSYCAILLDDNNRNPIARLWFNSDAARYFGTFDAEKVETRHPIDQPIEIYRFKSLIVDRIKMMVEA